MLLNIYQYYVLKFSFRGQKSFLYNMNHRCIQEYKQSIISYYNFDKHFDRLSAPTSCYVNFKKLNLVLPVNKPF